jgi:hypothetical protein
VRNDAEVLAVQWGVPIAIALVAVAVRLLFSANRLTLLGIARGVTVGLFVGSMVNLYLGDVPGMSDGTRGAIVGVSAVLAEDLIMALLAFGKRIREQPETLLDLIFRGKK